MERGAKRREEETTAVSCRRVLEALFKVIKKEACEAVGEKFTKVPYALYYWKCSYCNSKVTPH
jgi:hypothetical protein